MVAFGNQHRHRCALRIVILPRDVEDVGADDIGHFGEDIGQPLGVVSLVDVLDIFLLMLLAARIADVVDVEAQRLRQVVEPEQLELGVIGRLGQKRAPASVNRKIVKAAEQPREPTIIPEKRRVQMTAARQSALRSSCRLRRSQNAIAMTSFMRGLVRQSQAGGFHNRA